jgi:hypothetical protein
MNLNAAELAALDLDVHNIAAFFRLETDPVVRLWLGFGNIAVDSVLDADGTEYTGFGEIKDLPAFNQMMNGAAERVEFTLSGVSGTVLSIASGNDATQVKGKRVSVGIGFFGQDWSALLGHVHWFADYTADFLAVEQAATTDPEQPIVRTVKLSCGSLMTNRRRPALSYFSGQDQRARSPGDLFCNLTGRYAHGFTKKWPQFT